MKIKRVVVHLISGVAKQQQLHVKDDEDYWKTVNIIADSLKDDRGGALIFTTPMNVYRTQNITCVEFPDPLPPDKRPPLGFRPASE